MIGMINWLIDLLLGTALPPQKTAKQVADEIFFQKSQQVVEQRITQQDIDKNKSKLEVKIEDILEQNEQNKMENKKTRFNVNYGRFSALCP